MNLLDDAFELTFRLLKPKTEKTMKTSFATDARETVDKPKSEAEKALSYFLKDVKGHQMTIVNNNGVYRHVTFSSPGTSNAHFELLTWPGHLAIAGDMGSYMFSRNEDMFTFFRAGEVKDGESVHEQINPRYWAEKLISECKHSPAFKMCPLAIAENVKDFVEDHKKSSDLSEEDLEDLQEEVDGEILSLLYEGSGEYEINKALTAISDFSSHGLEFTDFHESKMDRASGHYAWCCAAIVWGIDQYDRFMALNNETSDPSTKKTSTMSM